MQRSWLATTLLWCSVVLFVLLSVGPGVWLLLVSLQPADADLLSFEVAIDGEAYRAAADDGRPLEVLRLLPNYQGAWEDGRIGRALINSTLVTLGQTAANVLLAALAAYPLARMRFRGRNMILALILATMMIPEQVILVPMFRTIVSMGLYDTLMAVALPFSVSAFGIFLCRQAFMAIPADLEEAARIDGAGSFRIWRHVMLPLSAPSLATLALFSMISAWSALLWPLMVLIDDDKYTLPVNINRLLGVFATNTRYAYAGSVLSLIPVVGVFILTQRWFKPELFAGSVKA